MRGYRVWAEIDLAALRHNISVVRKTVRPGTRIMAVVKADAYGHGALPVARTAVDAGCEMLGVGDSGEAIHLREGGVPGSILILGAILEEEIGEVVQHDISVTLHSADLVPPLEEEAARRGRRACVHVKVDTGMSRLGVSPGRAPDVVRAVAEAPHLELEGISTHFASGAHPETTRLQLDRFRGVLEDLAREGVHPALVHAANSAALFTFPETHFDLVRPGIALYGIDPGPFARLGIPLKPVLSLKTRIVYLKGVGEDVPIGYDGLHRTGRPTRIATCPAGYNDGYPYLLSKRGEALVRGHRVPVVGSVTMDYVMLDVGNVPEAQVGDEVTLIGGPLRVEELARQVGTIPYEITCRLGSRVKRVPVDAGESVATPAFRAVA